MIKNNSKAPTNRRTMFDTQGSYHDPGRSDLAFVDRRKNLSDHLDVFVTNQLIPFDNPSPKSADHGAMDGGQHEGLKAQYRSPSCGSEYAEVNGESYSPQVQQNYLYEDFGIRNAKKADSAKQYSNRGSSLYVIDNNVTAKSYVPLDRSVALQDSDLHRDSSSNIQGMISIDIGNDSGDYHQTFPRANSSVSPVYQVGDVKYEGDSDYSETSSDRYFEKSAPASQDCRGSQATGQNEKCRNFRRSSSGSSVATLPSSGLDSADIKLKQPDSDQRLSEDELSQSASEKDSSEIQERGKAGKLTRGAQNLPPCRVCGNKASGLHFGVNTCEACNEFFRRSLKRGASYYCTKNRECQVYGKKRNACSFCRYRRCVDMGMSRDAIKTGRYSHKTRTEYAMEVEEFRQKEMHKVEKEKYEVLLKDLVLFHDKFVKNTTRVPMEVFVQHQKEYLHLYNTQRELELRQPPLSTPAMTKKLLSEWSPVSEDLSLTMHDVEMTEKWLRNYINYAKNVPGFKELALSDQASLVRGTWFEFWFLGAYRGYNSKLRVVYYPNGRTFHEEEIVKVFGKEYTDFSFSLADRMTTLQVTPEEMVLIKTVCLTFPDRTPLQNREAVESMHWLMVSCLLHTLEKNRPGDSTVFPLIVSKLVELRTLTDIAMKAHKSAIYQDVLKESPLMSEMVDTKTIYISADPQGKVVSRMPISPPLV